MWTNHSSRNDFASNGIASIRIAIVTTTAQEHHQLILNDSSVHQIDLDYISYDDIFKRKHNGKSMLKDKHLAAWKALHAAHHIVRGWFKDWETDQRQHDILHLNFTKHPRMKDELNEFIQPKMAELLALVLAVGGSNGTVTYSYSWKQEDIYQHILSHRYDFRKKMKKRLSEDESSGSVSSAETILASQSLVDNKYPGGQ
ncbi:hypothetical protein R1flu_013750 [Riccia fluitans]|uniref:Uncharacterized protein n=1 Tax=Riccia fluitans TaxID=41844 RepID=A0ABD1YHM8_9MARC